MNYDRDIRWMRFIVLMMLATDLLLTGWGIYGHNWTNAVAAGVWAANCWTWLGMLRTQQSTRDTARLTDAGVLRVLESRER